jgi:hypothetical protein
VLGFWKNDKQTRFGNTLPIIIEKGICNTNVSIKDGVIYVKPNTENKTDSSDISSGIVTEEIRKCLLTIGGIKEASPIMVNSANEHRIGKEFMVYTIADGKRQFTITVSDNR